MFSQKVKKKFLRAYNDAGLLQVSRLDGWDSLQHTSREKREEFRSWLVDCHKASYVPICLAGSDSVLSVEPAVVMASHLDNPTEEENHHLLKKQKAQRGGIFRRQGAAFQKQEAKRDLFSSTVFDV